MAPVQGGINDLDTELTYLVSEFPKFLQEVQVKKTSWDTRVSDATERLSVLLKKPRSPKPVPLVSRVGCFLNGDITYGPPPPQIGRV